MDRRGFLKRLGAIGAGLVLIPKALHGFGVEDEAEPVSEVSDEKYKWTEYGNLITVERSIRNERGGYLYSDRLSKKLRESVEPLRMFRQFGRFK